MRRKCVPSQNEKLLTGIPEFDLVLRGGLAKGRVHLLQGDPGSGKTTIATQFLLEGVKRKGARGLYVSMSESAEELRSSAASHGWDLSAIEIFDLVPLEAQLDEQQTVLFPSEIELSETVKLITDKITETDPDRVVIDSLSDLRLLASDPLRYRRQILTLKQFLQGRHCTTLLLDDRTTDVGGKDLHSVVHGVISLEQMERSYGAVRRRVAVTKMRGSNYQSGWHDFAITTGEVLVFPSLIAEEHSSDFEKGTVRSGLAELDDLLGGGLDRGTVNMFVGPSGAGKSTLALAYVMAAIRREERAAYFSFDETFRTLAERGRALKFDVEEAVKQGKLGWQRANPSRLSPGEFVWQVRHQVEQQKARIVVIDSLNSYLGTMPEEQALVLQMHELLTYLNNKGIVTILILAQQGVVGDVTNPIDLSFLSDTVVLLRFFEAQGQVRKAISVVKKRTGVHELAIREYRLFPHGMKVGPPLSDFKGVLTGVPTYVGASGPLLPEDAAETD
ncbi:circadian clock protein KaiC [Methylobacterium variabile]|uniref:non-specific serine/threonine protein kinase n=1 Tax=Methylobacterium variabile TaxID=298794 RepID=A0A0J6SKQ8_9HYPH|nr:circadian clock protein KaiC [Methylobacterium variabile]